MTTTGLVRVTIAAPHRRIDMALPERSPVAEIVPGLLRHAGDGLADEGVPNGGWLLRRTDGTALDTALSLGAHRIRDGEVLHLVSRRTEWPELEYDDVVDAIAGSASRTGRLWGPRHTRQAGLAAGAVGVAAALVALVRVGPPWPGWPAWTALAFAVVLVTGGTVLARAFGDAGAGAVVAALGLPCAFLGGAALWGADLPLSAFGAPNVLAGSAALLITARLGHLGVVDRAALFEGATALGLCGAIGAWLATTEALDAVEVAAIGAGAALVFSPLFTTLSIRLSRVPMPVLPRTPADLLRDEPQPPRRVVHAAVLRADALLTGMLGGSAVAAVVCVALLARHGGTSAVVLLCVLCPGFLLRARLYPAIRHRAPLLLVGAATAACLVLGSLPRDLVTAAVAVAVGGLVVVIGLVAGRRAPNAYLGRYAEILEVVLVLACVPLVCGVLGLYGFFRGLGG